jgi:hypothetical protein
MKRITTLLLGFFIFLNTGLTAQTLTKHPEDQSVSRNLTLDNG